MPNAPTCRFCLATLRDVFVDLASSPLANSYLSYEQLGRMEPTYPLTVYVCADCLLVQSAMTVAPEEIFSDYAYFSSFSESWVQHARRYVEDVRARFGIEPRHSVVEIASNDGYLLQFFQRAGIPVLGVEPAANIARVAEGKGIPTHVGFFGSELARVLRSRRAADLIVGNNVLAHVPAINDFVEGLRILLSERGVVTIEVPHVQTLIEEGQFDTIYHEHFSYFSLTVLRRIFAAHDLRIFDVENLPTHGGSLRIYAAHNGDHDKAETGNVQRVLERERAAQLDRVDGYRGFNSVVQRIKRDLLTFLVHAKEAGKKVAAYGAPAKGNTLLNYCGVRTDFIDFTVDRNPHKQNHYLPGSHIPIHAPERLDETRPDYVLILPWNLREEIVGQTARIRSWGGKWVVAVPRLEVID